jgi:hypothetical protein
MAIRPIQLFEVIPLNLPIPAIFGAGGLDPSLKMEGLKIILLIPMQVTCLPNKFFGKLV